MGGSERVRRVVVVESGAEALGWVAHLLNHGFQVAWVDFDEETPRAWLGYARRTKPSWTFLPQAWDTVEVRRISQARDVLEGADLVLYASPEPNWTTAFQATQEMVPDRVLCAVGSVGGPWQEDLGGLARIRAPRQMRANKLLEVSGIAEGAGRQWASLAESRLGRCAVGAKARRPGVLQRLDVWLISVCLKIAERHVLSLELVEAATSALFRDMRHGFFRPLREFDATRHVLWSLEWGQELPDAEFAQDFLPPSAVSWMANVQDQNRSLFEAFFKPGDREALVLDPITLAYREPRRVDDPSLAGLQPAPAYERVRRLLASNNEAGTFFAEFLPRLLRFCDHLAQDSEQGAVGVDQVVEWGLGWERGPYELGYRVGLRDRPAQEHEPGRASGWSEAMAFVRGESEVVVRPGHRDSLEVAWKDADGLLDGETVQRLLEVVSTSESPRLLLLGGGRSFCAGVDYREWIRLATDRDFEQLERQISALQALCAAVSARDSAALVHGSARGFGMELALACRTAIVQAECDLGFDHARWGILPCGGGCAGLRSRVWPGPKRVAELIHDLALGWVADNAVLGKALGMLRESDQVVMHPDGLAEAGRAWEPPAVQEAAWPALSPMVSGMVESSQSRSLRIGEMTEYDVIMGDRLKRVFRATSWEDALQRERQGVLESLREGRTLARMRHMLDIERPLRN